MCAAGVACNGLLASAIPGWRLASFLFGMSLVWAALGSPLVAYDHDLLTVHMIQHLLLMTFAPALILLGEPLLAFWHGLPRFGKIVLGPLFRRPLAQRFGTEAFSAGVVLDCFCVDPRGMACAGTVYIGDAFRSVALCRAGVVFGGRDFFSGGRLFNLGQVSRRVRNGRPFYTFFLPRCRATSSPDFLCSLTVLRIPCTFRCRGTLAFLF